MKWTFDNYFLGCTYVSAIAAVFDPGTNLEFVHYSLRYLYGDCTEKHTVIDDALGDIFNAYAKNLSNQGLSCSFINNDNGSSSYGDNPRSILNKWTKLKRGSRRAELDKYLRVPLIISDGDFDILGWWHTSESHYYYVKQLKRKVEQIWNLCVTHSDIYMVTVLKNIVIHDALGYIFCAYTKNLRSEGLTCFFINTDNGSSLYGDNPHSILDICGKNR